jgi:hypothetical protein
MVPILSQMNIIHGPPGGILPLGFLTKMLCTFRVSPIHDTSCTALPIGQVITYIDDR